MLNDVVLAQIAAEDLVGARETANRIEAKRQQGAALVQIATVELRAGNIAARSADGCVRSASAKRRARSCGSSSRFRRRAANLANARDMLRDIDDPFYQALAAGDIAVAEVRAGRNDRADAMVGRVRRADRAQVYGRIALARADKGDVSGAVETLQKIDDDLHRAAMQGRLAAARAVAATPMASKQMFADGDRQPSKRIRASPSGAQ